MALNTPDRDKGLAKLGHGWHGVCQRERERSTWRYLRLSLASEEQGSNMKVHSQHPRASQGRIPCLIPVLTRAMADIWFLGSAGHGGVMCMSTL